MAKSIKELEEETNAKFKEVNDNIMKVLDLVGKANEKPKTESQKVEDDAVKAAMPENTYSEPVHPDWVADAKEKLGEKLDHVEIDYPKNGYPRYTIVIKPEFSNASKAHLEYYKIDRRTIPITNGFESVKQFNLLVAQNFKLNPPR